MLTKPYMSLDNLNPIIVQSTSFDMESVSFAGESRMREGVKGGICQ